MALVGRDGGERRLQRLAPLDPERGPLRVRLGAGRRLPGLVLELGVRLRGAALAEALLVHRGVDGDAAQPRADAPAAERAQVAVGGEEGLLHRIGGLVAIRDHPHDQREQVILVQLDEAVERIERAVTRLLQQDQVTAMGLLFGGVDRPDVLHDGFDPPGGDGEAGRV
ncbi:MAG: hypothetical protein U0838_08315 [Chloroflexota bacterium]